MLSKVKQQVERAEMPSVFGAFTQKLVADKPSGLPATKKNCMELNSSQNVVHFHGFGMHLIRNKAFQAVNS